MRIINILLIAIASLTLFACSNNNENKASGDHVWKEQTATIDRAKEVEGMLLKSAEERAKTIDEQSQ